MAQPRSTPWVPAAEGARALHLGLTQLPAGDGLCPCWAVTQAVEGGTVPEVSTLG